MPQIPSRLDETRQWLDHAVRDLKAAEILLTSNSTTEMYALFHCQQGVEKALKAFLLWHDQPFAKTHDLRRRAYQCAEIDRNLEALPLMTFRSGLRRNPEAIAGRGLASDRVKGGV